MATSEAALWSDSDQSLHETDIELTNLYHDCSDLNYWCQMAPWETKTSKIFSVEDSDLPLVESRTAFNAAGGDVVLLVSYMLIFSISAAYDVHKFLQEELMETFFLSAFDCLQRIQAGFQAGSTAKKRMLENFLAIIHVTFLSYRSLRFRSRF